MRHLKILGLLGLTAAALMAFGGHASATTLTSPAGTAYNGEVNATSLGHVKITNPIAKIECSLVFLSEVESQGAGAPPVKLGLTSFTFTACTNNWSVKTVTAGKLVGYRIEPNKARMFSVGLTFEATRLGIICRYATPKEQWIADLMGGTPATLEGSLVPFHSGSPLCGTGPFAMEGNLEVTSPKSLTVDE